MNKQPISTTMAARLTKSILSGIRKTYWASFARLALDGAVVFSITSSTLNYQLTGNIETQYG
jgi:hypothetical protein